MADQSSKSVLGKILIVDDSRTIRVTAKTFLQRNFEVVIAEDGYQAIEVLERERPNIVFVDVMMPRLDGYDFCSLVKNNFDFAATPIVMLTSKNGMLDRARAQLVQTDGYLIKPFTRATLFGAIGRFIKLPPELIPSN